MKLGLALAFLSGFVALSQEIAWFRVYSFASGASADAFALMLCAYLLGIALGALAAHRLCADDAGRDRMLRHASWLFAASASAFLLPPALAGVTATAESWQLGLPLVVLASGLLGAVFPLVSHAAVVPDERSGANFSYLYLANIVGSAAGSLLTGFWLLDRWPLERVALALALLSLAAAAALRPRLGVLAGTAMAAVACIYSASTLYGGLYEKLQFKSGYQPGERFARVVENRGGVITVTADGTVYGGGVYDGAYNVSPVADVNGIVRAYALAGLHPAPREVLMIGLSTGSWALVVAEHSGVERLTIVEINPGYLELLQHYPAVSALSRHPKVTIEIDDGRRWLVRHRARRFDAVVVNGTMHWRANATNLLSREFVALVRSALKDGGVYYFNTTGSLRAARTAADTFRHAVGIGNFVAASDAPLALDAERFRRALDSWTLGGRPVAEKSQAEKIAAKLAGELYVPEAQLRQRVAAAEPITDDNMGTEWRD